MSYPDTTSTVYLALIPVPDAAPASFRKVLLTFCVLSDITLFQQFNYMREETTNVSMQSLCFVRILHYGITDKWKSGVCPTGSVEFVPTLCLCSAVSC